MHRASPVVRQPSASCIELWFVSRLNLERLRITNMNKQWKQTGELIDKHHIAFAIHPEGPQKEITKGSK